MRPFLGEHYSPRIAEHLRAQGHDVIAVAGQLALAGFAGWRLIAAARDEGRGPGKPQCKVEIDIRTLALFDRGIAPRALGLAMERATAHQPELAEEWRLAAYGLTHIPFSVPDRAGTGRPPVPRPPPTARSPSTADRPFPVHRRPPVPPRNGFSTDERGREPRLQFRASWLSVHEAFIAKPFPTGTYPVSRRADRGSRCEPKVHARAAGP